jgi:hypothetical protein
MFTSWNGLDGDTHFSISMSEIPGIRMYGHDKLGWTIRAMQWANIEIYICPIVYIHFADFVRNEIELIIEYLLYLMPTFTGCDRREIELFEEYLEIILIS